MLEEKHFCYNEHKLISIGVQGFADTLRQMSLLNYLFYIFYNKK